MYEYVVTARVGHLRSSADFTADHTYLSSDGFAFSDAGCGVVSGQIDH